MPLFFSFLFLAFLGVFLAHLARKYAKVETTNRRWIVIAIANGYASALIQGGEGSIQSPAIAFVAALGMFILSAKIFGRVSWLTSIAFCGIYLIASAIMIIPLMILLGPEILG